MVDRILGDREREREKSSVERERERDRKKRRKWVSGNAVILYIGRFLVQFLYVSHFFVTILSFQECMNNGFLVSKTEEH